MPQEYHSAVGWKCVVRPRSRNHRLAKCPILPPAFTESNAMKAPTPDVPRLKPLDEKDLSDAQRRVYREIASGPRGGVRGPFNALLRSPELADRAQKLGEYVRFNASLPEQLKEFAILITARYWTAQYEWHAHHAHAMKAGLAPAIAADLAEGRRPAEMSEDAAAVFDFCRELHEKK